MEHAPSNETANASLLENTTSGLTKLLRAARKHWPIAVACVTLSTGISVVLTKSERKVYATQSLVEIDAEPKARYLGNKAEGVSDIGSGDWDTYTYTQTQYKIVVSDNILEKVVGVLGLASEPDFGGRPGAPVTPDIAAAILRGRVRIDPVKDSRLINIRIEDFEPKRTKKISDTLNNVYIEENLNTAISSSSDAVNWLNSQLDHVEKQLEETENALHAFKEKNELPSTSINDVSNMLRMEMTAYTEELSKVRTQETGIAARVGELERVETNPEQLESSELLHDPFLTAARGSYETALNAKNELLAGGKGANHPRVKEADARVESTHDSLVDQIKNIRGALEHDLATIRAQEGADQSLYESSRKRAVDLNMKEIEYHRLDRQRDQNEKLYQFLLERLKEADLAKMMRANNIHVVDWAPEPRGAIRPILSANVAMGLVVGLLIGIALAFLREQLDSTLKMPEDVEEKLGATFLGLLPEIGTDSPARTTARKGKRNAPVDTPELIVHKRPLSGFAEAARGVRTNLMFMNPDDPIRRILVTSAAPTEGKTMVACSLAIALAQGGLRVCIVDCDLRRPRLHRVFDRVGDAGITNILLGEATLDDVAKPTAIENLWSIPAGPMPPNPADALHSERFREIIRKLGERFDRVVIDSPPLVAVTDGTILSKICDGTVFVVRAFKTSKFLCRQALRSLRDVDAPLLGVVLNAVDLTKQEYTYNYYHYTYYKREGYGRPEEEAIAPPAAPN
jgi:polysaccharide biosynthesis transport protein